MCIPGTYQRDDLPYLRGFSAPTSGTFADATCACIDATCACTQQWTTHMHLWGAAGGYHVDDIALSQSPRGDDHYSTPRLPCQGCQFIHLSNAGMSTSCQHMRITQANQGF